MRERRNSRLKEIHGETRAPLNIALNWFEELKERVPTGR
jgi:hypothetical protein